MKTKKTLQFRFSTLVLLLGFLFSTAALPVRLAQADSLPTETCSLVGTTRTCDLWATTGTLDLPGGNTVPIWGYSDTASGAAQLPGPFLIVDEGETVVVNLTNNLPEATAILFQGQDMIPDRIGAAANGGTTSYTFTASQPGTYLYEAGLLSNSQHQVALGMYGALIVRPSSAFGSISGAVDGGEQTYASTVLADGPVHYYRLGECNRSDRVR